MKVNMNSAPTPEQIATLPKWAQHWIAILHQERTSAINSHNELLNLQTPSSVYWDDYLYLGEKREIGASGPTTKRKYVQTDRISVAHANVELHVSCRDRMPSGRGAGIELSWSSQERDSDVVALVPKSFQQAVLISRNNMP